MTNATRFLMTVFAGLALFVAATAFAQSEPDAVQPAATETTASETTATASAATEPTATEVTPSDEPNEEVAPAAEPDADVKYQWQTIPIPPSEATADVGEKFVPHETSILNRAVSFFGIFGFVFIAWLISEKRNRVNWRTVGWGIGLQLVFGAVVLSPMVSEFFYTVVNGGVSKLLFFAEEGSAFVFQTTHPHQGSSMNFGTGAMEVTTYGFSDRPRENWNPAAKTFAFWILPTIIFFSALMSLLYYLGIMQVIVKGIAWVMMRTLGTSGAESLSAAGNIFVGQTEAPLLIKPFVNGMTRSELMAVMTGGFATVAGGVLGAYVSFLQNSIPNIAGHLVIASIISAPAALAIAKVMVPETEESQTAGDVKVEFERNAKNPMEAVANGATDGMKLVLNVAAMLIAIVAIVAMFDFMMGAVPVRFCDSESLQEAYTTAGYSCAVGYSAAALTLSDVMGWVFYPFAAMMGVPLQDCSAIGELLGKKIVLTEFLAYIHLGEMINGSQVVITERSAIIASYALCGFANFASIGIQLGGIGGIAPKRMGDLASLGFKAMIAGAIAACMTGAIAGLFL